MSFRIFLFYKSYFQFFYLRINILNIHNYIIDISSFQMELNVHFTATGFYSKVGLSPSKKNLFYLLQWKPFKNDEKSFLFHLKALFDLRIFKCLFWLSGYVEKRTDYKYKGPSRKLGNLGNFFLRFLNLSFWFWL